MKKTLLLPAIALAFLFSCADPVETDSAAADLDGVNETSEPEAVIENYSLLPDSSSASWSRDLDQKPTKQKVKIFGADVEVEMGRVQLTMNGNANISEGALKTTDEELSNVLLKFDMASFKLAKEKQQGLFDVVEYPDCELKITDIQVSDSSKTGTGTLSLQGISQEYPLNLDWSKSEDNIDLTGSFTINTLDFPLREQVKAKDINKDVIDVSFDASFIPVTE